MTTNVNLEAIPTTKVSFFLPRLANFFEQKDQEFGKQRGRASHRR